MVSRRTTGVVWWSDWYENYVRRRSRGGSIGWSDFKEAKKCYNFYDAPNLFWIPAWNFQKSLLPVLIKLLKPFGLSLFILLVLLDLMTSWIPSYNSLCKWSNLLAFLGAVVVSDVEADLCLVAHHRRELLALHNLPHWFSGHKKWHFCLGDELNTCHYSRAWIHGGIKWWFQSNIYMTSGLRCLVVATVELGIFTASPRHKGTCSVARLQFRRDCPFAVLG